LPNIDQAAQRVARLLAGGATELSDARGSELEFLPSVELRPLERGAAPPDCWAVDGGQSLVADARCLQVVATRAARTRWQAGHCTLEDEGELRAHVLAGSGGGTEGQLSLAELASPVAPGSPVDINLLRD
jgi:hypothetical protein